MFTWKLATVAQPSLRQGFASIAQCRGHGQALLELNNSDSHPDRPSTVNQRGYHASAILSAGPKAAQLKTASASELLKSFKGDASMFQVNPRPKPPANIWVLFVREHKDRLKRENPDWTASNIASTLSKLWQNTDKDPYLREYNRHHEEYKRQLKLYEDSLSREQKQIIQTVQREKRALKKLTKRIGA